MIVRRFLSWARIAPAAARADATSALARAYLYAEMDPADRYEAEIALTVMLDDQSPLVQQALADALAGAADAPHHVISGLVALGGEPAALVLERSLSLSEAELVDAAALGGERQQTAIACRAGLPATVAAALAEVGEARACLALIRNQSAEIAEPALIRLLERFGDAPALREALLARPGLTARVRERLMTEVSKALKLFVVDRGWLGAERAEAVTRDAEHRSALTLACDERLAPAEVVVSFRESGKLTAAFVVHALLLGELDLVAEALASLSGTKPRKVAAFLQLERQAPLRAVLKRAAIPDWLAPIFPLALAELRLAKAAADGAPAATPLRVALKRILARLTAEAKRETLRLAAYLRGLEAETARAEARALAEAMITLDLAEDVEADLTVSDPIILDPFDTEPVEMEALDLLPPPQPESAEGAGEWEPVAEDVPEDAAAEAESLEDIEPAPDIDPDMAEAA